MTCDYAFKEGRNVTINQFHKTLNNLLEEATRLKRENLIDSNQYWRVIGQQDILLQLLNVVCDMINSSD